MNSRRFPENSADLGGNLGTTGKRMPPKLRPGWNGQPMVHSSRPGPWLQDLGTSWDFLGSLGGSFSLFHQRMTAATRVLPYLSALQPSPPSLFSSTSRHLFSSYLRSAREVESGARATVAMRLGGSASSMIACMNVVCSSSLIRPWARIAPPCGP